MVEDPEKGRMTFKVVQNMACLGETISHDGGMKLTMAHREASAERLCLAYIKLLCSRVTPLEWRLRAFVRSAGACYLYRVETWHFSAQTRLDMRAWESRQVRRMGRWRRREADTPAS